MGSEITYAEVNFKNGPSPVQPKAPSENKTPALTVFQKCPPWIPWVTSGVLLLLSIVLLIIVILVFFWGSSKNTHLKRQNATDWHCLLKSPKGKEQELSCCMNGWKQNGTSCYYFSSDAANWVNSRLKCTQMGTDLVVINSEAEQDFLNAHSDKDKGYWIGLRDPEQQNKWQWVDDTPLNNRATFWRQGEPSNPMENCTVMPMQKEKGMFPNTKKIWNDIMCTVRSNYICEAMAIIFY